MSELAPIAVALPLVVAALLLGGGRLVHRRVVDFASLITAGTVAVLCGLLLADASDGRLVLWFGGWTPRQGVAIGVSFAIDQVGAGLALFAALLFVCAFVFAFRYFVVIGPLFHGLMLVFLAAMLGFAFTGDLFTMFVFFELLSVAAYALVAYDIEEEGPLQGALNFAITNSVGAFFILTGIGLLYARTGALNMAQIGETLAGTPADGLVIVSFTLITVGFFTKAAVVPFHFWLADAYSVAPTPVCLLLSAAMSELGLFALARVFWTVFSGVLDDQTALQVILLGAGTITALVGGLMCFGQRHLKRLLAFATVSHVGLFLVGLGLLDAGGLAGTTLYVASDGVVKAALFVAVGVMQHRYGLLDELELRGRGRDLRVTGMLVFAAGLALASLPPFGPYLGKSMVEVAASDAGYGWVPLVFVAASVLTAAAVLRAGGRIFFGLGAGRDPIVADVPGPPEVDPELRYRHDRVPLTMTLPQVALVLGGLALGLVPGLVDAAERAAARFVDRAGYAAAVLHGHVDSRAPAPPTVHPRGPEVAAGLVTALLAAGLAAASLLRQRLPARVLAVAEGGVSEALERLRSLGTGDVADYLTWLVAGTAVLGGLFAATLVS